MTIIALFSRAMEQLISEDDKAHPDFKAIAQILAHIIHDYFTDHTNRAAQHVQFLLFGYFDGEPWIAHLGFGSDGPTRPDLQQILADQVYAIGDAGDINVISSTGEALRRISKHAEHLDDQDEEADTEQARHRDGAKRLVEESVLERIENEFSRTVGGFVQKLEVYSLGNSDAAAYTRESRSDILDRLPPAGNGLRYVPIGEQLGRKSR